MRDLIYFLTVMIIGFSLLIAALMLLLNFSGEYACTQHGKMTGDKTTWIFLDECYVHVNGHEIPRGHRVSIMLAKKHAGLL